MNSLAIIRATDILKLKSTLAEMNRIGLNFEGKPKEINPAFLEKMLSKPSRAPDAGYEVCALVPMASECETCRSKVNAIPSYSDVLVLDASSEFFKNLARMIPVLPDLVVPDVYRKEGQHPDPKTKPSSVYLGVFAGRKVQVQTGSGAMHAGILRHADSIGVFFEPSDGSSPLFITWHEIKKIVIPREGK